MVVPDMPGACCAMGETVDAALEDAASTLADFAHEVKSRGDELPAPSPVKYSVCSPARWWLA